MIAILKHTVLTDTALSSAPGIIPPPLTPRPPAWVDDLLGNAARAVSARGGVMVSEAGPFAQFSTSVDNALSMPVEELRTRVTEAYVAIGEAVSDRRRHPIRFWNFVPAPGDLLAPGLDRYMVFNTGRYEAYARWYGTPRAFSHALATASAVGVEGTDLKIFCLTSQIPGMPIENPRQTPSWRYSRRYGPKPPCFARATIISHARRRWVLIGGTASIVGEDSRHAGDPTRQLEETMANLSALIAVARGGADCGDKNRQRRGGLNGRQAGTSDACDLVGLSHVRAYVARAEDAPLVHARLVAGCPAMTRLEMALSQICRPELLVEIEGIAAL
jgi:enamine deaminase RidA (YjgF/YER057c/UK114 family)